MHNTILSTALQYAAAGGSVFPACIEGKQKKSHKSKEFSGTLWGATNDPDQIRRDFERWPDAMLGVPTGAANGFIVIEVDTKAGHGVDGLASLEALQAEHGMLPLTRMARTPTGSIHFYFRHPGFLVLNSANKLAPGIDVRGDGGMVIAPPSVRPDGMVEWLNDLPLADLPEWVKEWRGLHQPERSESNRETIAAPVGKRPHPGLVAGRVLAGAYAAVAGADEGGRNHVLNEQAYAVGRYVGCGDIGEDVAIHDLLLACDECGLLADDGEEQCKKTIKSGLGAGIKNRALTTEEMFPGAIVAQVATEAGATLSKPEFTLFDDCATSAPKVWLHKGVMALGENSSWYGEPGSLKSALITDIAVHAAAGIDWRGHKIKTRCGVVYFAFERSGQAKRRLAAYKLRDDLHRLPIAVVPKLVDLLDPKCVDTIVSTVERAAKNFDVPVGLIVLDTYNKGIAAGGGDENAAKDQNQAAAHLRLIHEKLPVHIAGIGHTGKDTTRGERGSNAREGDVDLAVQIAGEAVKTATIAKANDQEEGDLVSFKGEVVLLARDEDGDPITAYIVSKAPAVKEAKGGSKLSPRMSNALRALENAVQSFGRSGKVEIEKWREQLLREEVIPADHTNPREAFRQIKDGLVAKKLVRVLDGYVAKGGIISGSLTPLVNLPPPPKL